VVCHPRPHQANEWGTSVTLLITLVLITGINLLFWSTVGAVRFLEEKLLHRRGRHHRPASETQIEAPIPTEVAVLIAAHNEELVVQKTLESASAFVPLTNIYVVSDGSRDTTADKARASGVNVLELNPNRGKGGALAAAINHFELCQRYEVVLLLDADTVLSPDYLETGLPMFADPKVAAVSGRASNIWHPRLLTLRGQFLAAYRELIYVRMQEFIKYGQAWRHANAVVIVPGFASMYRTSALAKIEVNAPGLVTEDLNMTFEVHHRRLGRIAFHPRAAVGYTQDPDTYGDYIRQVKRWTLTLWQTVRRHGPLHRGRFGATLLLYLAELLTSSIFAVIMLPMLMLKMCVQMHWIDLGPAGTVGWLFQVFSVQTVLIGVVLPQYVFTILVATMRRRPRYLLLGLGFPILLIIDAAITLYTLPRAWIERSTGAWTSPTRRTLEPVTGPVSLNRKGP
jgi:biofilm PGA synthesis N-glycosyltransferase PgaC